HQRSVTAVGANLLNCLFAEHRTAITAGAATNSPKNTDPPVSPDAGHNIEIAGVDARNFLATLAHNGKERFNTVNAIPEKVGVRLLQRTRAVNIGSQYTTSCSPAQRLPSFGVPQRR